MAKKATRDDLLAELERLDTIVDGAPRLADLREHGDYSKQPFEREFGGWTDALDAAGITGGKRENISRADLLDELQRLAGELEKVPTRTEMNEHGTYSRAPYDRVFGGWNDALDAAGLEKNRAHHVSRDDLLTELRRLAEALGKVPTMTAMREHGEYSERPYKREFGSWNGALEAAGFEPNKPHGIEYPTMTCEWCGDEYQVRPSKADGSRFCSNQCKDAAKSEWVGEDNPHPNAGVRVTIACEWCGDSVEIYPHEAEKARFCSLECLGRHNGDVRSGPDSPRWRGGYEGYYGPIWPEQREKALERDGYACLACGSTDDLVVHHVTPFREFVNDDGTADYAEAHRLENLRCYCRNCHAKIENDCANDFGG